MDRQMPVGRMLGPGCRFADGHIVGMTGNDDIELFSLVHFHDIAKRLDRTDAVCSDFVASQFKQQVAPQQKF